MRTKLPSFLRLIVLMSAFVLPIAAHAAGTLMVYKDAYCGCCTKWIEHMQSHGFEVRFEDRHDMNSIKMAFGVPRELASCHTAVIDGYWIEGHVPAADVKRLLEEQPEVAGLAVPGMPMGSPGMEGPTTQPYNVVSFSRDSGAEVYNRY